ncbi:MAG TPA: glycosyltransferase, partial [Ktedonobacterales bacterium]
MPESIPESMPKAMECAVIVVRQERRPHGISGQGGKRGSVEISVLIPVFNERNTILEVVRRVQEQP